MSVSRLSKFQAFILGHQSDFKISEVSSYPITLFYTFMESHDDYASFHGSVAQFQHVLAEICVIEICLSSRHSFQDNNLIMQCLRSVLIQLPCSTHCWKDILIVLLATFFMDNSLDFTPAYLMKLQGILEKLNKIFVANLKWQHQRTIDSFFKST